MQKQKLTNAKKATQVAKRKLKHAEKKLKGVEEEVREEQPIIFKPNSGPQTEFLASNEREVLYGGAAGGGKSYALLADVLRYCDNPNHSALIIRRTNDELRELVQKSQDMYPKVFKGAHWSERKSLWTFPSGARIWMTYLEQDKDVLRYQGQAFTWIGVDELTQYPTPYAWDYLRSRLRTTDPKLPIYMRATSNPGGPGHVWVKKMFIDPSPFNRAFDATDIESGKILKWPKGHEKEGNPLFRRRFIPAKLSDNPYLAESGEYEANLLSLPEVQRIQLLEGSWDIAEGAAFNEFPEISMLFNPMTFRGHGENFGLVIMGIVVGLSFCGWLLDLMVRSRYIENFMFVKKLLKSSQISFSISSIKQGTKILHTESSIHHVGNSVVKQDQVLQKQWSNEDVDGDHPTGPREVA